MSHDPRSPSDSADHDPRDEARMLAREARCRPPECAFCDAHRGQMMPSHTASANRESGGHNHCTCDVCF